MDTSILKKLNLIEKEINIYLKLLEHGALSVRGLAEITGLNRGTTYDMLKKLQEINLVSYHHHETKQKFTAEEPGRLVNLIKTKEAELGKIKESFEDLIPELKALQDKGGDKPTTKFYEGKLGIKLILEDVLSSVENEEIKEYYIYSATEASDDWKTAYPNFTRDRIKKEIKVKAISLAQGGKLHGFDERRWLGTDQESATFIFIYALILRLILRLIWNCTLI